MIAGAAKVRWTILAGLFGLLVNLLATGRAHAQTMSCNTDKDCPNPACGGDVCMKSSGGSLCVPANTSGASGLSDGWCADADGGAPNDNNCKCKAQGAKCDSIFCSFTIPPDGGAAGAGGGGGGGGSTGTGGSGTGTGGSGVDGGAKGGSSGGGGGGGCSVAGDPSAAGAAGAAVLLAAVLVPRRRRRRG